MSEGNSTQVFTDAAWAVWEPLIEAVRPHGKTPPKELRRTISAIFWRHQNGAKWRSIPAELGPWWLAAQLFIRWAKQGVWERLLELVQQRGELPPNWWTPLLSSEGSGKVSNGPGTASFYG